MPYINMLIELAASLEGEGSGSGSGIELEFIIPILNDMLAGSGISFDNEKLASLINMILEFSELLGEEGGDGTTLNPSMLNQMADIAVILADIIDDTEILLFGIDIAPVLAQYLTDAAEQIRAMADEILSTVVDGEALTIEQLTGTWEIIESAYSAHDATWTAFPQADYHLVYLGYYDNEIYDFRADSFHRYVKFNDDGTYSWFIDLDGMVVRTIKGTDGLPMCEEDPYKRKGLWKQVKNFCYGDFETSEEYSTLINFIESHGITLENYIYLHIPEQGGKVLVSGNPDRESAEGRIMVMKKTTDDVIEGAQTPFWDLIETPGWHPSENMYSIKK